MRSNVSNHSRSKEGGVGSSKTCLSPTHLLLIVPRGTSVVVRQCYFLCPCVYGLIKKRKQVKIDVSAALN